MTAELWANRTAAQWDCCSAVPMGVHWAGRTGDHLADRLAAKKEPPRVDSSAGRTAGVWVWSTAAHSDCDSVVRTDRSWAGRTGGCWAERLAAVMVLPMADLLVAMTVDS